MVVDLNHGRVDARAETLDLHEMEEAVRRARSNRDPEVFLDGVQNVVAATQHARRRTANLHVVAADFLAVEHGIEARDLVDADRRHFEDAGDLVHRGERQPAVALALGKVEESDHGRSLVVLRVLREHGLDLRVVRIGKIERRLERVVGDIAVNVEAGS